MSGPVATVEMPTYFGPVDSPLFGAVHLPADHRVRGAVVICGSIAKEHMDTVRGLRLLADELASRRILTLRFDYLGVGDSADAQVRDDTVARWKQSISTAVGYIRDCGVEEINAVGLRAGTLILDSVVGEIDSIRNIVYWDPVGRGRAFIREQQSLYRLTVGSDDASPDRNVVEMIGASMSAAAAKEFSDLDIRGNSEHVSNWLLVSRPEATDRRVAEMGSRDDVTHLRAEGLADFTQPSSFLVRVPVQTVGTIATWIDDTTRNDLVVAEPVIRTTAAFTPTGANDSPIIETIESLGERGAFAIRSRPGDAGVVLEKTVVFFSTANDTHIGPNREWVDLGRAIAAAGGQALRWDRTGAGESGKPGADLLGIYTEDAINQSVEIGRLAAADPRALMVTGVCSGSWYAAYVARALGAGSAVLVNSIAWSWRRKSAMTGEIEPDDLGVPRSDPEWQKTPRARVKAMLQRHLPYWMWRLLGVRGVTQVPEVLLRPLVRGGVSTTVILSPHDHDWFGSQRGPEGLARLERSGPLPRIVTTGIGDHTAYHRTVRSVIRNTILGWVEPEAMT
ncbi:alpha/beta hydrolase [Williamsia muralis]|uniref:alpha/beta hydrolase n=1 Tax=Williamsia marianensis TaxID=85044 RepID=UPI003F175DEB